MAGFTAQIQDPGRLYDRPQGGGSSGLGALGDLLKGGAAIADTVIQKNEADDARNVSQDVGKQLTSLVQENFGSTPQGKTPALVGEPNPNPAASSPVVKDALSQLNGLDQANKQGALSPQELMTRGSVIVQDAINRNPLYAQEIRQAAQSVLGVQPTQDLVKSAEEDSNRTKALNAEVTHSQVMAAANSGITYLKPDGTPDIEKMSTAGGQLLFQEKQLDQAMKQAQLTSASMPQKPTHDEQISAETTPFIKNFNPVFDTTVDGMLSSVPALVAKFSNQGKDQQVQAVLQAIGTQQAQMNNYIDKAILRNNVSPDAAKQLRDYYNAPFESMKGLTATGDFSSFSTTASTLKKMSDTGQINFRDAMPITAKIKDAGGDQAVGAMFGVFLGTNTNLREGVNAEANANLNGAVPATVLGNAANVMAGKGYDLSQEQNPDVQSKTLKGLVATMNSYTAKPDKLSDVEQGSWGNITNQVTRLGISSNDPTNLSAAAGLTNTPAALATYDNFAKNPKNANSAPVVAQGMIALNTKNIQRSVPLLQSGETNFMYGRSTIPGGPVTGAAPDDTTATPLNVKATIVFNPVTGKAEPSITAVNATTGQAYKMDATETAQAARSFQSYFGKVTDLNRSMDAVQHLAPNGIGREKEFKPLELRQLLASGSGLATKPGMNPVPMPAFMQPKKAPATPEFDPRIQDSQRQTETGAEPNNGIGAVSDQGAVGPFQIRPQDFPQYDADKLKNDFDYAKKANGEIMTGLLKKYKGNHALALAEYHGGPNQSLWGPKTFAYVSKTLGRVQGE